MPTNTCNKLQSWRVEYEYDNIGRKLRLIDDIPEEGYIGGSFSDEYIEYDKINKILCAPGVQLKKNSIIFQPCFDKPSSNTGPMLAAVLVDMGVIDKQYKVLKLL